MELFSIVIRLLPTSDPYNLVKNWLDVSTVRTCIHMYTQDDQHVQASLMTVIHRV